MSQDPNNVKNNKPEYKTDLTQYKNKTISQITLILNTNIYNEHIEYTTWRGSFPVDKDGHIEVSEQGNGWLYGLKWDSVRQQYYLYSSNSPIRQYVELIGFFNEEIM